MPKRTKTSVTKSLDKLISKLIRSKNPYCRKCGKPTTEVHHIFSRRNKSVRWTPSNLLPLCSACHIWSTDSFEKQPYSEINMRIILNHVGGEQGLDELRRLANTPYKATLSELLELERTIKDAL